MKKKNGIIELLRFIFCIYILLFHIDKYLLNLPVIHFGGDWAFFVHGSIGVEFFFLVSGYLMASSAFKINTRENFTLNKENLSKEYLFFIKKKYLSVFPQHSVAFILALVTAILDEHVYMSFVKTIKYIVGSIPNFFLIQMSGINIISPNHLEWYISAMLIAMALLFPFCIKYYRTFTRYVAPLLAILILGYLQAQTSRLTGVKTWTFITYKSVFRAIAEIALGATAFEISRYLSSREWSKSQKNISILLGIFCFSAVTVYLFINKFYNFEIIALILLFILVIVSFSDIAGIATKFNNKVVFFLGKFSMSVYLAQLSAIYLTSEFLSNYSNSTKLLVSVILTFIIALIVYFAGNILNKKLSIFNPKQKSRKELI